MRDPLSRGFSSLQASQHSWLHRVRDNFHKLLAPERIFPSSANGAPLHLLRGEARTSRAQGISILTHAAIITALTLIAVHPQNIRKGPENSATKVFEHLTLPRHLFPMSSGATPDPGSGSGGGRVPIPATTGNLVPPSSIQLVRPSLPPKQDVAMPVPPTIYDPAAPPVLAPVDKIGFPWMNEDTNSPGPGDSNTIGSRNGSTMGDGPRDGLGGEGGSQSRYRGGVSHPTCAYCPDPQYTDEAREAKLQGKVTLRVLVGADGRAAQIRIVQGIGLGLDERAEQAIRGWKFVPAHDAAHRAVPDWVTVEAVFRLF
jgi:periplasmic protein TonB